MTDANLRIGIHTSQAERDAKKIIDALNDVQDAADKLSDGTDFHIDTDGLDAEAKKVKETLKDIEDTVNKTGGKPINLTVDTGGAEKEIDRVVNQPVAPIVVPVQVDDAQVDSVGKKLKEATDKAIPKGKKTVVVDADVSGVIDAAKEATDAIDGIGDAAEDASKGANKAAVSLSAIEAAADKVSKASDAMGNSVRNAMQEMEALELIGEALLAIGTSMVTAILDFESYGDAVRAATGDSEAASVALEMIEELALSSALGIEDLTLAFHELRTNGLDASRDSLVAYANVAAGLNLTMEEMSQAVGDASARNFTKLNETQLKAKESGDKVIFTYHGMTTEVANTSKAIAAFIRQMGNTEFAGMLEEQADSFTGAVDAMSDAWKELVRDMGEGGLNSGLQNFGNSMRDAAEAAEELGRIVGAWLGDQLTLFGKDVEGIVEQLNDLVAIFDSVKAAINSIPTLSGVFDSDFMKRAMPALYAEGSTPDQEEQGPPTAGVSAKAFGEDTETQRKRKRVGKSDAERQAEAFARQSEGNNQMLRTLKLIDESFIRGRGSVEGFRNSIEETTLKQSALKSVGKENADAIVEQAMAIKAYKESIAVKNEVLDQQESIMQTVELAEAFRNGAAAVEDAKAKQEAYNTAVQLGVSASPELVAQFHELALAAATANNNLQFEQSMAGLDEQIQSAAKMATAFREGGPAIREAALEQAVYAQAVADGVEHDEDQVQVIRDKMLALRDLQDVQASDERALGVGLDIEQMERELQISNLVGEARYIEAARIEMLMNKKRELKDVTAELTNEELKQADALGRLQYQSQSAGNALMDLAERYGDVNAQMQGVALGGALALEDSLVDIMTGAKSAREAFTDFAKTVAEQLMRAAIQMAIIRPLLMGMGGMFAGGGVMTSSGPMSLTSYAGGGIMSPLGDIPLKTYSSGGIANSPQMAIFGEGKMPEAYVPLPDGRRIPVKMEGGGGGGNALAVTNNINVNMPQNATREQGEQFGDAIARQVEDAMNANLMKQQRPGGLLDPYGYGGTAA